ALDSGAQHRGTTLRVEVQVLRTERTDHTSTAVHGRRDVVELEVGEDVVTEIGQRGDRIGTYRAVQLEPDLGCAEPRAQLARQPDGNDEVVDVEDDRELVPDLLWHLTHRSLR